MNELSSFFLLAFCDGSGIVADCDWCDRTHFHDDHAAGDWEEGELEGLQARAKTHPDRVVARSEDVRYGFFQGRQTVIGCPCRKDVHIEQAIWGSRWWIIHYLTERAESDARLALDLAAAAQRAKKGVEERRHEGEQAGRMAEGRAGIGSGTPRAR